jgi:hypothetical protein
MSKKVRMTTPKLMFMTLLIVVIMLAPIIGGLILSADTTMGDGIASAKNRHFPTRDAFGGTKIMQPQISLRILRK